MTTFIILLYIFYFSKPHLSKVHVKLANLNEVQHRNFYKKITQVLVDLINNISLAVLCTQNSSKSPNSHFSFFFFCRLNENCVLSITCQIFIVLDIPDSKLGLNKQCRKVPIQYDLLIVCTYKLGQGCCCTLASSQWVYRQNLYIYIYIYILRNMLLSSEGLQSF